jgi:geranylgeranylglycerol-phosphate geranylgeranyltransferase
MSILKSLISIARPANTLLAGVGIFSGYLYSGSPILSSNLLFLILAGSSALAFGNVINDLVDIETDKISHPNRALPSGKISINLAILYLMFLGVISVFAGFCVSIVHGVATLLPLFILMIYSLFLKGTPLAGNITVSLLVAYTLVFGSLGGNFDILLIPAILAFLSSFSREIVKDLADKEGDELTGVVTTASLPLSFIKTVLISLGVIYILLSPVPVVLGELGVVYGSIIIFCVTPLHFLWIKSYLKGEFSKSASYLKIQMLFGLLAVVLDKIF